jgi:transposase
MLKNETLKTIHYKLFAGTKPAWRLQQTHQMNNQDNTLYEPSFAAFIGLDWADEKHAFALCLPDGSQMESGQLDHTPQSLQQWAQKLQERFKGQPVAIALELSRGPLVWALAEHSFLTLYPVTPHASAEFRRALHPSGAKSDPADSLVLLKILRLHRDRLRPLRLADTSTRLLDQLCRDRRAAVEERTQCVLRLTAALKEYFPLALEILGPLKNDAAGQFLLKWGSLRELQEQPLHRVRKFFHGLNCRSQIEERLEQIAPAQPLTEDAAVIEAGRRKVQMLATLIISLNKHIDQYEERIEQIFKDHPDREIFSGLPGAGAALAPRLLAAFGADRARYQSAEQLSAYTGIAPIERSSGKTKGHYMRLACPKYLRQTFHEFAGKAVAYCPWSRKYYQAQTAKGKKHNQAVRSLAFKWMRVLWACWNTNTPYDQTTYLKALQKSGSPYAVEIPAAA